MKNQDPTKDAVRFLLTQNTGRHFLDSGGAYGRHWERNQTRDFDAEPEATVRYHESDKASLEDSLSTYHWLSERLEFNERLDNIFHTWASRPRNAENSELGLAQEFPGYLRRFGIECTGIYGDGEETCVNTYNGECALDQTLQFVYFELDNEEIVLLAVHGGCDVRGGYSDVRVFNVDTNVHGELCIFDYAKVSLECAGKPHPSARCPTDGNHLPYPDGLLACSACTSKDWERQHRWTSDNAGYRWDDVGDGNIPRNMQRLEVPSKILDDYADWSPGTLWIFEDKGLCPVCGSTLSAGSY